MAQSFQNEFYGQKNLKSCLKAKLEKPKITTVYPVITLTLTLIGKLTVDLIFFRQGTKKNVKCNFF